MKFVGPVIFFVCAAGAAYLVLALRPPGVASGEQAFVVKPGEGFFSIANRLAEEGLVRSAAAFKILAVTTGGALKIKPGAYRLSPALSSPAILGILVRGSHREVAVTIPEGASLYEVDALLSRRGIIERGSLIHFAASSSKPLEGKLFPDTYQFFIQSDVEEVVRKLLSNFELKAEPILAKNPKEYAHNLILASLLEREVPDFEERRLVAGILKKRLRAGVPLQVDASICYAKEVGRRGDGECLPITAADLKIGSPYNTYIHSGWPPGPIGNPGLSAIRAALEPLPSSYWYYLSDLKTRKTIFAATLEEHARNKALYLRQQ